jgi:P27 family predicted phage terminase small subunit
MKGRKPKPTSLRLIEGNREHRTIHKELEPQPEKKAPPCPAELRGDERKAWAYLILELGKMGTLASSDRGQITGYCHAWGLWCRAKRKLNDLGAGGKDAEVITTENGNYIQNPWLSIANRAMADCVKYGAELGLNPVQRTRVKLENITPVSRRERLLG